MRPIDLLAFRVDDDHKSFLKMSHEHEKNYKIKKQYQAFSWGRNDDFQLGFMTLAEDKKCPKRIFFDAEAAENSSHSQANRFDTVSIRDIACTNTFALALSEDGKVYSWGRGVFGRLGNGDEQSQTLPTEVKFDFRDEHKKINRVKKDVVGESLEDVEELLF